MADIFHTESTKRPKPVPIPDEKTIEQEKRREDTRRKRSGRSATILSDGLG